MSTRKVDPDHLGEAIDEILTEYANTVTKDVKSAVEATGKMAAETAQAYASRIGRGKYAKSIKAKTMSSTDFETSVTVYSTQYRIAHLLEHGHVVKVAGKVVGMTRAFPHFQPAEAMAEATLPKKVEQAIKGA